MKQQTGFTLIELMVTVVIVAIIAGIALPSYQEYVRRQRLAQVQQEMNVIAGELERFKSKNLSYTGFDSAQIAHIYGTAFNNTANGGTLNVPVDNSRASQYTITLEIVNGMQWRMTGIKADARNFNVFMDSTGFRCKTKTRTPDATNQCGSDSEAW